MLRLIACLTAVLMVAMAWPAAAQAPGPVPGPAPGPSMGPAPGPTAPGPGQGRTGQGGDRMGQMDPGRMLDMLAQRLGLTDAEKAATEKAMRAKMEAGSALSQELQALGEVARNEKSTDQQIGAALRKCDAAIATYRQKVKAIDAQLGQAVSLRARASLTAMGIIDNGMGMGGRFGGRARRGGGDAGAGMGGGGGARRPGAAAPAPDTGMPRVVR